MVDYSKWDALELSDDSDIEVHPNVDKRSFIRAKQSQIHMERQERSRQIQALKYERVVNGTLVQRLSDLLSALKLLTHDAQDTDMSSPADTAFQILMRQALHNSEDDYPPPRPENVFHEDQPLPSYSKMMAGILDEIKKTLDAKHIGRNERYATFTEEVGLHLQKIQDLQGELSQKLDALEKEGSKKITSESYHTGFDSSHVNKTRSSVKPGETTNVELLNPRYNIGDASSGGETQVKTEPQREDDGEPSASPAARKFAQIDSSDYRASYEFLSSHPEILQESETDGLFIDAFNAALEQPDDNNDAKVWQYVHQAMLLQYCRILGRDGVAIFFKRIVTQGHQARQMFQKEVAEKFQQIKEMARENAKRLAGGDSGGVEQIQLYAVEPGTSIQIRIPRAESEDEEVREARAIFDGFAPHIRTALESGSLDEVNRMLGAMDIHEAERLVGLLGDAGYISVEKEIIDATTEEGRKYLRDMENDVIADVEVEGVEMGHM